MTNPLMPNNSKWQRTISDQMKDDKIEEINNVLKDLSVAELHKILTKLKEQSL